MLYTTQNFVEPWIKSFTELNGKRVLEIGCGEGGNLLPFEEEGATVIGVDRNPTRIEQAGQFILARNSQSKIRLETQEAMALKPSNFGTFDIVILKDFIEHVDQGKFLPVVKELLSTNGVMFIGFPPWLMPYGGHQQVCRNVLSRLPWLHLLPRRLYLSLLSALGEASDTVCNLEQNYHDGINIETLDTLLSKSGFQVLKEQHYLINPGYEAKFGLKPTKQLPMLSQIPWLRNFYTTCCYLLVSVEE